MRVATDAAELCCALPIGGSFDGSLKRKRGKGLRP
jgi:hypothetical protein